MITPEKSITEQKMGIVRTIRMHERGMIISVIPSIITIAVAVVASRFGEINGLGLFIAITAGTGLGFHHAFCESLYATSRLTRLEDLEALESSRLVPKA